MIETLFQLVKSSGVDRMNLSIQSIQGERASVCIQCILGDEPEKPSEDQRVLREALSRPIVVEGVVGEVDAKLDELLTAFVKQAAPLASALVTNVAQVKDKLSGAAKAVAKAKATDKPKDDGGAVAPKEAEHQDEEFDADSAQSL